MKKQGKSFRNVKHRKIKRGAGFHIPKKWFYVIQKNERYGIKKAPKY